MFRRIFGLPLVTLALLLTNLLLPQPGQATVATVVALAAPPEQVTVGDPVTLSVNIAEVKNLYGIEIHLRFDAERLQVLPAADGKAATPGALMGHDFVALNAADNAAGTLDYAAAQMNPRAPANGSGALLTIRFKALAAGNAAVNFTSVILSDINGVPLMATTANIVIAVIGDGATPPPATPEPGITALAPPADAPTAAAEAPSVAATMQAPPNTATVEPRGGATTAAPEIVSQQTREAAANAPVALPTAIPTPVAASAAGADPATPAANAFATPVAGAVAPTSARVAQPAALPVAPTRINDAPARSVNFKTLSLLVSGAISLLFAVIMLLERRRRGQRP